MSIIPSEIQPCHPSRDPRDCTCWSLDQLKRISNHLKSQGFGLPTTGSKKQLWRGIHVALSDTCKMDHCWTSHPALKGIVDDEMLRETFRPKAPDDWTLHIDKPLNKGGKYVWLSNFDIDAVMKQYEELEHLKNFKFYKSAPIDFAKIDDPVARINIWKLKNQGIDHFAIVFNIDKHNQPGSHWNCLYCNVPNALICFFDSYGRLPEPEIQDFMAKICIQALLGFDGVSADPSRGFPMTPLWNSNRFQRLGSECGQYSLFTLITLLHWGGTAEAFGCLCKNKIDDATMNSYRRRLFIDKGR